MTPAEELRAAAEQLRALAAAAEADVETNRYWRSELTARPDWYANGLRNGMGGPGGDLAAAMHPGVGTALADWLDVEVTYLLDVQEQEQFGTCLAHVRAALIVARQILGSQP